jgi:hypothetical protein
MNFNIDSHRLHGDTGLGVSKPFNLTMTNVVTSSPSSHVRMSYDHNNHTQGLKVQEIKNENPLKISDLI